ncbi:MAG TPA: phosphoserine phosphatase SerB [Hypericibacter adhaerens]|uniref:phosphoserine phosphatase SerB n=1 Tax=Hypericibacter adhaerens TaxID=2602016 RepID=UPI002D1535AE|nr:phosphoserine phosphatase SerB [Hypericibacter adhaerens]HWA43603.1 phosphoserine phosphatase SerB [Hypericibacter adhaerens]
MPSVLTLIAAAPGGLADEALAAAREGLREINATPDAVDWLAPGQAFDLRFEGADPAVAERALRSRFAGSAFDLAAQPAQNRRKKLLVADMESTIITRELLNELAAMTGLGSRIIPITERSMRGEIDFAQSLRERVALLKGLSASLLDRVADLIEPTPGARALVQTMRAHGAYTALVSGGFDRFTRLAAELVGMDEDRANHLVIEGGTLAGRVTEPILDPAAKKSSLLEIADARGIGAGEAAAVGDGANDIPMLQAAGLGVAFRGKPAVAAAAKFRLDHADLTGLLYLQGYHANEFRE